MWAVSGPELKSIWPRFGPFLLYLVYSWLTLGLPLAYLLPKFSKQERNFFIIIYLRFSAILGTFFTEFVTMHYGVAFINIHATTINTAFFCFSFFEIPLLEKTN